jgi:hypothetical protein
MHMLGPDSGDTSHNPAPTVGSARAEFRYLLQYGPIDLDNPQNLHRNYEDQILKLFDVTAGGTIFGKRKLSKGLNYQQLLEPLVAMYCIMDHLASTNPWDTLQVTWKIVALFFIFVFVRWLWTSFPTFTRCFLALFVSRWSTACVLSYLFGVRCSVFGVRCSVFGVCCLLFAVCCLLFAVCYLLFAATLLSNGDCREKRWPCWWTWYFVGAAFYQARPVAHRPALAVRQCNGR